jgi:hypothetical chaperone protein
VNDDLGYNLHQAVQKTKIDLSKHRSSLFKFAEGGIEIDAVAQRKDFEKWIYEEVEQIENCVDGLLRDTRVTAEEVHRVFLTGGSSFVPAVRKVFETRFGPEKIRTGSEFTSVAQGLALKARNH